MHHLTTSGLSPLNYNLAKQKHCHITWRVYRQSSSGATVEHDVSAEDDDNDNDDDDALLRMTTRRMILRLSMTPIRMMMVLKMTTVRMLQIITWLNSSRVRDFVRAHRDRKYLSSSGSRAGPPF